MLLRNTRNILRRDLQFRVRFQNTDSRTKYQDQEEPVDFRPPWVYVGSRLMSFTVIPGIVIYSVFLYDFGDRDHVFQPVRRWALRQKAAFLTPSPDEERILSANENKSET